jgi:6-phosphogluconate dehydrogenase
MSYHGKLQVLKNGTADAEIQLWAYQQLEKELSLTNKEILEEWDWNSGEILATDLLDFADAILRKAQEK